jgi:hypothetical protein
MVTEGNSPELLRMAGQLEQAALEIDQVPLESSALTALRAELTATWRRMAASLAECATEGETARRASLEQFRDGESHVPSLFAAMSELCNSGGA